MNAALDFNLFEELLGWESGGFVRVVASNLITFGKQQF